MDTIKPGDLVYSFIGESLERFIVTGFYDELRIMGENNSCTFCVYIKDCYKMRHLAVLGMLEYLERIYGQCQCELSEETPETECTAV